MALATVRFDGSDQGKYFFKTQLGSNRYFQYSVGEKPVRGSYGLAEISELSYVSDLVGPLRDAQIGQMRFAISDAMLSSEGPRIGKTHWLQVTSFRDAKKRGMAVSEPVQIPRQLWNDSDSSIAFSVARKRGSNMSQQANFYQRNLSSASSYAGSPVRVKAFNFQQKKYSNAMFIQALLPMLAGAIPAIGSAISSAMPAITAALPSVLPHLAPLLGGLLGSLGSQTGNAHAQRAGQTAEAVLNQVGTPANAQHLAALLQQLLQLQQQGGAASASGNATTTAAAQSYSQAQVAPLLAALPALMPLLQQVLTPETVQGIVNMPNQHMQTIINGIKDVSQLAIQSHEQDLRHLREIHPDLEDPELQQLLMSMSANVQTRPDLRYQRVAAVDLTMQIASVTVNGQTKVVYAKQSSAWRFPFQVSTPRTVLQPQVQCVVKEKISLRTVLSRQFSADDIHSGDVVDVIELSANDQQRLKAGQDYLVSVHLVWKNQSGEKRGTSRQVLITPMEGTLFDRIETQGQLVALDDSQAFADHWHKIWQDRFTREVSQHIIEARYYLQFDAVEDRLARFESQARFKEENRQKHGQLRTGVEWTLTTLNELRQQLLPNELPLTPAQNNALKHADFKKRFGMVAHSRVDIRASNGKFGEVWVYPVVKLQNIVLLTPNETSETGLVASFHEQALVMPIPVQVHFVGFKS